MVEVDPRRTMFKPMDDYDLVRHHYNRRALWGTDSVLYHQEHPMNWAQVEGNYQNWEIDTNAITPSDAHAADGSVVALFQSDDLTLWMSRRSSSMAHFFRNCTSDELHVISRGRMAYETDFGTIEVAERDLLVIPKGVTYRVVLQEPSETFRMIYESGPEMFLVPTEMVDHVYAKGRPAVAPDRLRFPRLAEAPAMEGPFEVYVKYRGAFADFMGEMSTIRYDFYPLDARMIDGDQPVYAFSVTDIEKLGSTPVPFIGGAYLDNRANLAWTLHLTGGGNRAPVHRNPDVDELRFHSSGSKAGAILFTPQGVDHGAGRGYTQPERNRPHGPYDEGDVLSLYTFCPLKGTRVAFDHARPCMC